MENLNKEVEKILSNEENLYIFDENEYDKMFKDRPWSKE